ncbi:helix-turn-helix transcriptional regulator [Ruficoccus amylovorans]|uniref:Helix-turn-helix transcriptional regulator n=1 Tax=Ruficoccus amylovorans TaxID=1804625 RepID=A0A842HJD7_9BACT|nr:AraC family transcriptional regulator [Ruficoccus amylovorans]MBC2595607.1 helix-turn-helix transcriptional regulator [Ruficoccus amylovorans]
MRLGELIRVGHYHNPAGRHPIPKPIARRTYCLELMTGGRGWVQMEGQWVEVLPGALLWHQAGDYTIGRSDFEDPYRCLSLRVKVLDDAPRPVPHLTWWQNLDAVCRFADESVSLYASDRLDHAVLRDYILSRLRLQAELYLREAPRQALAPELQRVLAYVEKYYAAPLRLEALADIAQWSVPHLHARFREALGCSPHQHLIERRIEAARVQLAGTNDPIKKVAADCGFSNASALCVMFRRHTHLSPAAYRRRQVVA